MINKTNLSFINDPSESQDEILCSIQAVRDKLIEANANDSYEFDTMVYFPPVICMNDS